MINSVEKKTIMQFLKVYVISSVIFLFYLYILVNAEFNNSNYLSIFLFITIGFFSYYILFKTIKQNAFSLNMMHWFFCFIFYGMAGFIQYLNGAFVYELNVPSHTLNYVLLVIILWLASYYLGSNITNKSSVGTRVGNLLHKKFELNYNFVIVSTIICILITIYVISQGGFASLLSRSTADYAFKQESAAGTSLLSALMRNFVLYTLAFSIIYCRKYKKTILPVIIVLICCFIVNPIFGLARFNVAIVYLGTVILFFQNIKYSKLFILIFFTGFVVLFPMINVFRNISLNEVSFSLLLDTIDDISMNFLRGDYDAFSIVINTINHISQHGLSYGYQFLGAVLFFIPRSIWQDKPFGSGYTVRLEQGESFLNVSSPLIAESLINFGLIGVIIFGFFLGRITTYIDRVYWNNISSEKLDNTYIGILYPYLLSMFFFMNRGDLLSTFSFAISHIAIFTLMFWINNSFFSKPFKYNKERNI